ncbi:cell envelope biogenesis protein TolA [Cedecea davisae]|uniref:Cell envelope biogenesis protein TolA n=1 Tax=Cedecea davisae TaxID=158484 RepID=A0ABS6DH58_9ENTR|nr:cell envelope biogenesis protein TolA [Cedecea davisae]MBU4682543.1 cell envelope biogenesis protein TolA [Cedecea davisae]MBU4687627.1 cell envelope biogenesis protein TolA [Cedecea davisae]
MSESKELVLFSLPSAPTELEAAFINDEYISNLISEIREKASSVVGDVKTVKGRGVYISMASNVRKTKTAIDDAGKALVAEMKKRPALVDASRKKVRDALDELAVEIRRPATEWEAEQERIKQEEEAKRAAEELEKEIEMDHREALIDNYEFDRALEEAKAEAERQRIAHEEELKRQAAEKAKREAAEAAQREIDAAAAREREATLAKERAEREAKEASEKAEREKKEAAERAEREKQEAIAEANRKAQEEADRVRREAEAKEAARLAEEKRIADEAAQRAADVEHQRDVNRAAFQALVDAGIPEEYARECIKAIALGKVPHTAINY